MTKHTSIDQTIQLSPETLAFALERARAKGMTLSEYIESILRDPWRQPVPSEINAQWEKEIAEFDEEEQRTGKPRKTYYTAEEFIKDMQGK
jgi:hypothetical protein